MNKPPAPLELQRLTDNGSSVGGIAPLYTSVDVAQSEHKEYLTQQVSVCEGVEWVCMRVWSGSM